MGNAGLAMDYEYLMRKALQCGRSYDKGADADIYRRLERSYGHFTRETEAKRLGQPATWLKPIHELENDYHSKLGEVNGNVDRAIAKVLLEYSLSSEQQDALNECRKQLLKPTFESLEEVIEKAQDVMIAANINLR